MTKVNPNNGNKTKNLTFFHGAHLNLTSFFTGCKIMKYFNGIFYYWHLSISLHKMSTKQVK